MTSRPGRTWVDVARMDRDAGEEQHRGRAEHHAEGHQPARAEARHQARLADRGGRHDHGHHRQEREAGLQRREAQGLLHVVGEEQEDAEHPGADDRDGEVGAAARAVGDDAQRQQRVLDAALDRDERGEQRRRRRRGRRSSAARPSRASRRWRSRRPGANRPAEAVIVPGMSIRGLTDGAVSAPRRRSAAIAAGTARIRFTYMHQRQSRYSVSAPPRIRPTAAPEPAITPNTPKALLRSDGIVKVVVSRLSAAGASSAAKPPCSARATTRTPKLCARPPSAEAHGETGEAR